MLITAAQAALVPLEPIISWPAPPLPLSHTTPCWGTFRHADFSSWSFWTISLIWARSGLRDGSRVPVADVRVKRSPTRTSSASRASDEPSAVVTYSWSREKKEEGRQEKVSSSVQQERKYHISRSTTKKEGEYNFTTNNGPPPFLPSFSFLFQ